MKNGLQTHPIQHVLPLSQSAATEVPEDQLRAISEALAAVLLSAAGAAQEAVPDER